MALYSTWDWSRNSYRIYSTSRPASVGDDPVPPRPSTSSLGANPDTDVKPLPAGTKFVGYSHVPRGEIRRERRGIGDLGDDAGAGATATSWWKLVAAAAAGAVAMHLWMKRGGS